MVTIRHHETYRVMLNSYPEWRNFQFTPNNQFRLFFFETAFKLEYVLFYQFLARITTFSSKKCSVRLLSKKTSKHLLQNDVKTSRSTSWRHPRGCLTPPRVYISRTGENPGKPCRECKKRFTALVKITEYLVWHARKNYTPTEFL